MILLLDIGNTHTHLGLAGGRRLLRRADMPTASWLGGAADRWVARFVGPGPVEGAVVGSVVPQANRRAQRLIRWRLRLDALELNPQTVCGIGFRYPKPETLGADRLANAMAVRHLYGAPAVAVDFGTAATFDVLDAAGNFIGGIIAPGLAAMTDYLHEKTALLPRIQPRRLNQIIGTTTEEAMQIGAGRGYCGLVRELLRELQRALNCPALPIVATGGDARFLARHVPEITAVEPALTLEGLRLAWRPRAGAPTQK